MSTQALVLHFLIGFPLAVFIGNWGEWIIHKRVLHLRGKRKGNFWNFHWYDHHNEARRHGMHDPAYDSSWLRWKWDSRTKEAAALTLGAIPWIFLFPWAPGYAAGSLFTTIRYYYVHKRAHLDIEWCRTKLPWHYDHHMGPNQDANWGVTAPWWDWIMGTREPYCGTDRETEDNRRRDARALARSAGATAPEGAVTA